MADERIRQPVKITDPLTDANEAGVDASGNLQVVVNAAIAAGTNNIGDVDIASFAAADTDADDDIVAAAQTSLRTINLLYGFDSVQWERITTDGAGSLDVNVTLALPTGANTIGAVNLAEHGELDDIAVSVGGALVMAGLVFDDIAPINVEEGDAGYQRMSLNRNAYTTLRDAAGAERGVNVTAANELNVLATAQPGVDIGDVTILDFAAALNETDDDVVASALSSLRTLNLLYGFDGTNWERLQTDGAGALDVNITAGGGEALPTNPVRTEGQSAGTAPAVAFDVDGPESGGTTKTVRGFRASASVPIKCELLQVDNDVDTVHVTLFGRAGEPVIYDAPHRDFHDVTFAANAGFDGFTLRITNLDNTQTANVYGTLYTED